MRIIAIKSDSGYYISDRLTNETYGNSPLGSYFINGEKPTKSFHKFWFFVPSEVTSVQVEQSQPNINHRYELIDKMFADKLQPVYKKSDVFIGYDDDGDAEYTEEFAKIRSLYREVSDPQPNIKVDVDFTFTVIEGITEITEPTVIKYKRSGDWNHKEYPDITNKDIKRDMIYEIITPAVLIHNTPAKLTSRQAYDIVRRHIKDNINPMAAEITSDYNFCFTVKKKIQLAKEHRYEVNIAKGKRKPNMQSSLQTHRSIEVFEMTPADESYKGYTIIDGFEAENDAALKDTIDSYLAYLMAVINEPIKDCPCCEGTGIEQYNKKIHPNDKTARNEQ